MNVKSTIPVGGQYVYTTVSSTGAHAIYCELPTLNVCISYILHYIYSSTFNGDRRIQRRLQTEFRALCAMPKCVIPMILLTTTGQATCRRIVQTAYATAAVVE